MEETSNTTTVATIAPGGMTTFEDYSFTYRCVNSTIGGLCAQSCVSLEACEECECAVVELEDTGGPWGQVMDVIFCLLPIIYLVYATIKPNPTPTTTSLPISAAIMFLVRVMYLASNPLLCAACVILGFHEVLTPLSIMAGAIALFETMEATKCLPYMMREMKALTAGHPVAEAMLLFAFAYLVEGASGFGTPVALGAPMLVSTGNPPLESVVVMLLFNTFATVWGKYFECGHYLFYFFGWWRNLLAHYFSYCLFISPLLFVQQGAVGTPLWFGFGELKLSEEDFIEISLRAAIAMVVSAFCLMPLIISILVPMDVIKQNIVFLYLALATVMGPVVGLSAVNYEFPSLMGGLIGCGLTAILIKFKVGLKPYEIHTTDTNSNNNSNNNTPDATPNATTDTPMDVYNMEIACLTEIPIEALKTHGKKNDEHNNHDTNDNEDNNNNTKNTNNDDTSTEQVQDTAAAAAATTTNTTMTKAESISGTWNVEVTAQDPVEGGGDDDDDIKTVVTLEPKTSNDTNNYCSNKEEGMPEVKATISPPLVEEDVAVADNLQATTATNDSSALERSKQMEARLGPRKSWKEGYLQELILRTFPIWGVVLILLLTRVQQIGIKPYLVKQEPYFDIKFGTYGEFRLSVSVVFQLRNILTYPGLSWKYELFYVPFLIPFCLVSALTMLLYRKDMTCKPQDIVYTVMGRLSNPAIALAGALTLVQLMIRFGTESPAYLLGTILADWLQEGFVVICPLLGALGSFFSGSTTVSNLTFGEIQKIAAESIGTSVNTMLALQAVGGSAGNGICLNNIIAALAVVGLNVSEGQILMRTGKYVFASTTIATGVMLAIYFRF